MLLKNKFFWVMALLLNTKFSAAYELSLPECDTPELISQIQNKIIDYQRIHPQNNTLEYRRRKLLIKNLSRFEEVPLAEINAKDNFLLSSRLIALKINEGYVDEDFRVCRNADIGGKYSISVLMYNGDDDITRVELINFLPPEKSGETFGFNYTENKKD